MSFSLAWLERRETWISGNERGIRGDLLCFVGTGAGKSVGKSVSLEITEALGSIDLGVLL